MQRHLINYLVHLHSEPEKAFVCVNKLLEAIIKTIPFYAL